MKIMKVNDFDFWLSFDTSRLPLAMDVAEGARGHVVPGCDPPRIAKLIDCNLPRPLLHGLPRGWRFEVQSVRAEATSDAMLMHCLRVVLRDPSRPAAPSDAVIWLPRLLPGEAPAPLRVVWEENLSYSVRAEVVDADELAHALKEDDRRPTVRLFFRGVSTQEIP